MLLLQDQSTSLILFQVMFDTSTVTVNGPDTVWLFTLTHPSFTSKPPYIFISFISRGMDPFVGMVDLEILLLFFLTSREGVEALPLILFFQVKEG